jgi:hypothetical protein
VVEEVYYEHSNGEWKTVATFLILLKVIFEEKCPKSSQNSEFALISA